MVARLVVGGVWIVAGWLKIPDPTENIRAVRAYDLLPEWAVQLVGHSLPILELVVGVLLILGLATRWMGVLSAIMLIAFIIGISSAWARGLSIECGCFGGGGGPAEGAEDKYPWELARDFGLLALSAFLIWRPRTPYALDNVVMPEVPAASTPVTAGGGGGAHGERTRASQQAAAIRREAAAKEQAKRNRSVTAAVLVAVLAVVGVGYSVQSSRDTTGQVATAPNGVDGFAFPFGEEGAQVTVDVYEDLMCPYCGLLEGASRQTVEELVATGDVRVRYHVIAFLDRASTSEYSSRATNALAVVIDTAGAEVAKRFHDLLFENQPPEGGGGLDDDTLIELAVEAGADEDEIRGPIEQRKFRQWVRNGTDAASKDGVNSTPTVFVDGEQLPQVDIDELVTLIEQEVRAKLDS